MEIKTFFLLMVFGFFLASTSLHAAEKFSLEGATLIYNSELASNTDEQAITEEDADTFKSYFQKHYITTVRLTSWGGQRGAYLKIRKLLVEEGVDTEVSGICVSACAEIFLVGKKRKILDSGKLGFHNTIIPKNHYTEKNRRELMSDYENLDFENALAHTIRLTTIYDIAHYADLGFFYLGLKILSLNPLKVWYPTPEELEELGIVNN